MKYQELVTLTKQHIVISIHNITKPRQFNEYPLPSYTLFSVKGINRLLISICNLTMVPNQPEIIS